MSAHAVPRDQASPGRAADGGAHELPVTVVIPAYNRAGLLPRALAGVRAQRPAGPAEVIVVDDGSSDETAAVAERLGARVIRHGVNRGLAAARNTGLRAARHDWVALLDSDDEWLEHHLAHLWSLRGEHALVAASALRCTPAAGADQFHGPLGRTPRVIERAESLIFPGNPIPVSAAMVRRDAALRAGGFIARKGVVEDLDLWLRMIESASAICSPRVGLIYHLHDGQMSGQRRTMQLAHLEAGEAHRLRTGSSRAQLQRWEGAAAWENLRLALARRDAGGAARCAWQIGSHPRRAEGWVRTVALHLAARRRAAEWRGLR